MFGIFKRKILFKEIWSGTPEMHCHILPGIDDGAKNVTLSEQLLQKYASLGCTKIIATPHTMGGIYNNTPESIKNAYKSVNNTFGISLSYSSEYMLDDNFERLLKEENLISLPNNLLLVEMSFFQPPENLYEQLFKIGSKSYIPIMAHPERYAYYHGRYETYSELKKKGCLLQLNALSLTKHYGESVQKVAFKLLEDELYDFIGLDTHRMDHLEKIETMTIPEKYKIELERICAKTKGTFL